ncbi:PQQ-like beta-propeller repeat protein [bacterium]|nr:PQQ-like beta-propeller repeat protein [bacterium]
MVLVTSSMYFVLVRRVLTPWSIALVILTASVSFMVWVGSRRLGRLGRWALGIVVFVGWGIGFWTAAGDYLAGEVPIAISGLALFGASLWNLWLGWMHLWPQSITQRFRRLGYLMILPVAVAATMYPRQMTGDEQLLFAWRWASKSSPNSRSIVSKSDGSLKFEKGSIDGVDFPQYLGPDRDGRLVGPALDTDWDLHPPTLLWQIPVGPSWSGFCLVDDLTITQEQQGSTEAITAYRIADGTRAWIYSYPAIFRDEPMGSGPRATPTVAGSSVIAVGGTGILHALDRTTGKVIWSRDLLDEPRRSLQLHGNSSSPLVLGNLVIVSPSAESGPSLVACRLNDGVIVWEVGTAGEMYCSPFTLKWNNELLVVHVDAKGVFARRASDGAEVWSKLQDMTGLIPQPVVVQSSPLQILTASYDLKGASLWQVGQVANEIQIVDKWSKPYLKSKFSTPIVIDGFIYGLDNGILQCVDSVSGESKWKKGRYKHGQLLAVDKMLLILTEEGELVLVEPDPGDLQELGRVKVLEGRTWNPLAMKGSYLLARNAEQACCYQLSLRP